MKFYEKPDFNIISLESVDILTSSNKPWDPNLETDTIFEERPTWPM